MDVDLEITKEAELEKQLKLQLEELKAQLKLYLTSLFPGSDGPDSISFYHILIPPHDEIDRFNKIFCCELIGLSAHLVQSEFDKLSIFIQAFTNLKFFLKLDESDKLFRVRISGVDGLNTMLVDVRKTILFFKMLNKIQEKIAGIEKKQKDTMQFEEKVVFVKEEISRLWLPIRSYELREILMPYLHILNNQLKSCLEVLLPGCEGAQKIEVYSKDIEIRKGIYRQEMIGCDFIGFGLQQDSISSPSQDRLKRFMRIQACLSALEIAVIVDVFGKLSKIKFFSRHGLDNMAIAIKALIKNLKTTNKQRLTPLVPADQEGLLAQYIFPQNISAARQAFRA